MQTIEQWEAEAMRLAEEYGGLKWDEGLAGGVFDSLGRRRFQEDAAETLSTLSAHLATHPGRQGGWQPIDSAPKDGTEVLLAYPGGLVKSGKWTKFDGAYEDHWADGKRPRFGSDPTHWQPLSPPPALPKEPTHD